MLKKILTVTMCTIIIVVIIGKYNQKTISVNSLIFNEEPFKIGVLLSSYDDPFLALIKEKLELIQKANESKVQYEFFDGKGDQDIQNKDLNTLLQEKKVDLILLNLVNPGNTKYAIDRIKENNLPVIFFGGIDRESIKSYDKAYWIGTDAEEGGVLQGQILVELYSKNKEKIDKNQDNIIQYIMLRGQSNDLYAIERTNHSILTATNAGIRTQELASRECNWSEKEAYNETKILFSRFGNQIEMIIANNDAMAIGAIKALQEYGYNTGDEKMTIPVVGFDGIKEAQDLIEKGFMAGTVVQDPNDYANTFYRVGMNLLYNKDPIEGTECKFYNTTTLIILPHTGILTNIN